MFVNSSQYFTAGQCSIILHIWTIAVALAMASCILFLEFDCNHLVYSVCKFCPSLEFALIKRKKLEECIEFFLQTLICYNNPASHPFISTEERNHLNAEMGQIKRHKNLPSTPWTSVLTSVPVLALICGQVSLLPLSFENVQP